MRRYIRHFSVLPHAFTIVFIIYSYLRTFSTTITITITITIAYHTYSDSTLFYHFI